MANVIERAERERADVLRQVEQAADQIAAWMERHESLVHKAFALGVSQRVIARYAQVDQATVSRMIARARAEQGGSADVGRASAET